MSSASVLRGTLPVIALAGAVSLGGCSMLESLVPDKQKEYRYGSELPPLEVPPDLTSSTLESAKTATDVDAAYERERATAESGSEQASETSDSGAEQASESSESGSGTRDRETSSGKAAPAATLAQGSDDVPLIEVEEPFAETWNDVSRSLGRMEVEISDQNRSDGVFYVYYGGDTKKYVDRGIWQDFTSLFSGDGSKAQEFRIKLEGRENVTNVFVLDKDGEAVSDGVGLDMLKKLQDTLQNLDKPEPAEKQLPEGSKDES